MKARKLSLFVAMLMLLTVAVACNGNSDTPADAVSPSDVLTTTPTSTPTPSLSPSPTPTATPVMEVEVSLPPADAPLEESISESFKDLGKDSDMIVRGEFIKKLDEQYNAIRSMDDESQPDPGYLYAQEQYEFKVTEIYKEGKKGEFKVGDTIVINIDFSDSITSASKAPVKSKKYLEMNLNEDTVLFLMRETLNPKQIVYQTEADIYCFTVEDGKLYARCYDDKKAEEWMKKAKATDGIPIANMKKDIGIN